MTHHHRPQDPVGLRQNLLQGLFHMMFFIRQRHHTDHRSLPGILEIQFRHRHIKMCPQAILQAAKHLPLILQRLRLRDMQLQCEKSTGMASHPQARGSLSLMQRSYLRAAEVPWAAASAADSLVTWKHSRMSPTLTSLKFAIPRPHSNPVRTSLASSLKRFSELSFDV